ncbi:hypothetical protein BDQ17DRAFT_414989 [Cyathus striatus]|nr:hypothetical protein BDQ17DRAFT_414989 [Cyathus striatus]
MGARSIFDTLHRVRQFTPPAPKLKFCSRLRAHAHEAPLDVVPFIQEQLVENEPYPPLEINSISDHIQVVNARSGLCLLLFNLILVVRVLVLTVGIFFRWWFNDKEEVGRVSQVEDSALENPVGDEISESEVVVVGSFESDVRRVRRWILKRLTTWLTTVPSRMSRSYIRLGKRS